MRARGKIIGALEAINKRADEPFTVVDISTLTTLAAQAAVAIENARLFQQSDLIAEMVHELRTPLSAIKATVAFLKHPKVDDTQRGDLMDTITDEVDRLTRMTSNFLDLARLESGRAALASEPLRLSPVLNEVVESCLPQANERDIALTLHTEPVELPEIPGDEDKLRQVLLNLVSNGIKYNREGGTLSVDATAEADMLTIVVTDTGQGIRESDLPHIFERFYRVTDDEGYTEGTGLGLAITKRIVEGHGGAIYAESGYGQGTQFIITLPLIDG